MGHRDLSRAEAGAPRPWALDGSRRRGRFRTEPRHQRRRHPHPGRGDRAAGFHPGDDVAIALDPATSELYRDGRYHLAGENKVLDRDEMVEYWRRLVSTYPIVSIEDGMAEDDWEDGPS